MTDSAHDALLPSPWIRRWSHLVRPDARVLDVACGNGRHMRWFSSRGCVAVGVDRAPEAVEAAARYGRALRADLEAGSWPLPGEHFGAVIVTNYLWRPLLPAIIAALAPGGVLLYETFAAGNETVGRPTRADFLLRPGELLAVCSALRVIAYEDGFVEQPARFVQRIAAVRPGSGAPTRYPLQPVAAN